MVSEELYKLLEKKEQLQLEKQKLFNIENNKSFGEKLKSNPEMLDRVYQTQLGTWINKGHPKDKFLDYWNDLMNDKTNSIGEWINNNK